MQNLAQGLRRQGHEVSVVSGFFAVKSLFDRPFCTNRQGIAVLWLPLFPTPNVGFQLKTIMPPNLFSLGQLLEILARKDFDIVNIHGFGHMLCDTAAVLCRIFRKKYVLTIHGFPKEPERRGGVLSLIYRTYTRILGKWTIGGATAVVAVSNSIARECAEHARHGRVAVIQNAIDTTNYFEPPSEHEIHEAMVKHNLLQRQVILCIGRLSVAKGFQYVIRALPIVRNEIPNAHLVIVGKDDGYGYSKDLGRAVIQEHVESCVSFVGGVDDEEKKTLLWIARVVAIPSIEEPFGIVALEAMASGRTVVASRAGGLSEILCTDKYALLVESGNAGQLACALIKMMKDESARIGAMEDRARRIAKFDFGRMVNTYADLYRIHGNQSNRNSSMK